MFYILNKGLAGLIGIMIMLSYKELNGLSPITTSINRIFDTNLNAICVYTILSLLFLVLPIISITIILGLLKKQVFSGSKCIKISYSLVFNLFFTTCLLKGYKLLFVLFTKMGLNESFYLYIRLCKYNDNTASYFIAYDILLSYLIHNIIFTLLFMIAELYVTYNTITTQSSISQFINKNIIVLIYTSIINILYIIIYLYVEYKMEYYKVSPGSVISTFLSRVYESFIINALCLWLYTVIAGGVMN